MGRDGSEKGAIPLNTVRGRNPAPVKLFVSLLTGYSNVFYIPCAGFIPTISFHINSYQLICQSISCNHSIVPSSVIYTPNKNNTPKIMVMFAFTGILGESSRAKFQDALPRHRRSGELCTCTRKKGLIAGTIKGNQWFS